MARPTLCFTCGQPATIPPRLNDLPDGEPCSTCRERALEAVAPALPGRAGAPVWARDTPRDTPRDPGGSARQPRESAAEDRGPHQAAWRPDYEDDPEPA